MNQAISVVVPCSEGHIQHLDRVLTSYDANTILPTEVVISLSNLHKIDRSRLDDIARSHPRQNVVYTGQRGEACPSDNRNIGSERSRGDIIVYQDADDTAHPQRLEAILRCFNDRDIVHLVHFWQGSEQPYIQYDVEALECRPVIREPSILNKPYVVGYGGPTLAGAPAIRREVFNRISWPVGDETWGEDFYFNFACLERFNKSAVLLASLYKYFKYA